MTDALQIERPGQDAVGRFATTGPESVEAALAYIEPSNRKPSIDILGPGLREENHARFANHPVEILNGRWRQESFSLDREGFAFTRHHTAVTDFDDEDQVVRTYYPEMEALLKSETGATDVFVFDHMVRRDVSSDGVAKPVRRVHNDYTAASAPRRVRDLLGDQTGREFAVVNVWRAIDTPIETSPLALADAQSVADQDVITADLVYPDRVGEIYYAAWNPMHRWTYFPRMTKDEALLIKGFDSREDGRARFSLHTAFDDPTTPETARPRQSVEIRAFTFFD